MGVDLSRAVAVITGGGSGIGRGAALAFARRGAQVVVSDINADRAQAVAREIGDRAAGIGCDVTSTDALTALRDFALERFGRIDIVMNNVGVVTVGAVEDTPLEAWQRMVEINLLSVVRSNLVFLPLLLKQGSGHIVNTGSMAGLYPYAHGAERMPYIATKYAVVGLSEALATYLRPRGIGVSCFCPAGVWTNIVEQITYYGEPKQARGPSLPMVTAEVAGDLIADAVETNRFLVLTASGVADEMRDHARDVDAYLEGIIKERAALGL